MPTLAELANAVNGKVVGDPQCCIERVATLQKAGSGDISFLANRRYYKQLKASRADAVIVLEKDVHVVPNHALVVHDPYVSYAKIAALLYPLPEVTGNVAASASVHDSAEIGADVFIGENCVVAAGARIGAGCYIGPGCVIHTAVSIGDGSRLESNVTVLHACELGQRVLIHPGVVIGADGFGLANQDGHWLKIPQVGRVLIGDDVEIGANTTIDRGAIDDTLIGDGVKLDNLIQVGHNVSIGAHTAIAACTAIAGSTKIGQHCAIGGKVGIVGHLEIVDNVTIMGMTHVTQSISSSGTYASGLPAQPVQEWRRGCVRYKQLDELTQRIKTLEKQLNINKSKTV